MLGALRDVGVIRIRWWSEGIECVAMDAAEETRSFPILVVYWFLLAVALAFAVMALLEVDRLRTRLPFQMRVLDRTLQLEVREINGRRGKYKELYAVADLRLETRQVVNKTEDRPVSKDERVMHSFLDRWEGGAALPAMERDGQLEIDPPPTWLPALALFPLGAAAWGDRDECDERQGGTVAATSGGGGKGKVDAD